MAITDITKPMALDETLQGTNTKMDAVIQKLQGIIDALGLDTSVYKPKGNITCAALVPALLIDDNLGNVYNVTDNGTTTSDFVEGAGKPIHVGDNVAIVDIGTGGQSEYKFDLLAGMVDLTNYVQKSATPGLLKNDGTVDETPYTVVESSTTNGNIVIDDVETPVYRNYGNNAVLTTDKTPFLTRQTLNPTGFSGYVREKLIGASYAWNQLVQNGNFADSSGWNGGGGSVSYSSNKAVISWTNSSTNVDFYRQDVNYVSGHKYLIAFNYESASNITAVGILSNNNIGIRQLTLTNTSGRFVTIAEATATGTLLLQIRLSRTNTSTASNITLSKVIVTDLTLAFGGTIADYLYSLANNAAITKLRDMGCPIDKYTPYGYGLYSVKTSGKLIRGFNQWDEETELGYIDPSTGAESAVTNKIRAKNFISVLPNTQYKKTGGGAFWNTYYDANKNYISYGDSGVGAIFTTPANCHYLRFGLEVGYGTTYNHDICINISDTNKNGQYEPYCGYEISLGNDELRGKFDLVNGEIVASGDVKESNGIITRHRARVDMGSLDWTYNGNNNFYSTSLASLIEKPSAQSSDPKLISDTFEAVPYSTYANTSSGYISCYTNGNIHANLSGYTTASAFKTAVTGKYFEYELATPTTEQSTPFADPMSLVGATTEEYIDTRDIPCPVGAERQYMGQSEDVVKIPSSPLSDGKRKLVAETSGGKTQYYFEDDKNGAGTQVNLMTYNTSTNKYVCPSDGYISLSNAGTSVGDYIIMSVYGANDNLICGLRCDTSVASIVTVQNLFVKRGMKCYVRATSSTGSFTALFTPLV